MPDESYSFEMLYEQHFEGIYHYCFRKIGNKHDAEEIANETFIKAYFNRAKFDSTKSKIITWLFAIARRLCIDFTRSRRYIDRTRTQSFDNTHNKQHSASLQSDRTKLPDHTDICNSESQEVFWTIEKCIRQLGVLAEFVELYYYLGFTLAEIASIYGNNSPNSARKNLKKAEK
ncbi:MAG: RNA polymerase sigma factor [bacterium]